MGKRIVSEHFNSIYELVQTCTTRENSEAMEGMDSSEEIEEKSGTWYKTTDFNHAKSVFLHGYTDILKNVLDGVTRSVKLNSDFSSSSKSIPKNNIIGYAPNVPRAILGLPDSMINIDRIVHKVKTINVLYLPTVNCGVSGSDVIKAGIALLSAIKIIELSGVFVNLSVACKCSTVGSETCLCTVKLKNYDERLDLQKLCFPIAHPSMQRRFGFKWLETCPNITSREWRGGYGRSYESVKEIRKDLQIRPELRLLNAYWIKNHNCDVNEIIKYLKNGELK